MTTYYMRADGTAANKGAATGPGATQANCMNVSVHNAETFSAGDVIKICDDGGIFRETITPPSSGSAGNPITYEPEAGDAPKAYGSAQLSSWTDEGGNLWYASYASEPDTVWFQNTNGTIYWGKSEATKGALDAEYDWWFDDPNDRIYCYAASDPDSRYTSVEASVRANAFFASTKTYITLDGLEVAFCCASHDADGVYFWNADGAIVKNCYGHHNGELISGDPMGNGVDVRNSDGALIQDNICYENARRGIVCYAQTSQTMDDAIVERNICYDNHHSQFDFFMLSDGITFDGLVFRRCLGYLSGTYGTYGEATNATGCNFSGPGAVSELRITNATICYNVFYEMRGDGCIVINMTCNGINIYNNVCYGFFAGSSYAPGIDIRTDRVTNITIKNNIAMDNVGGCLRVAEAADVVICENNCWYHSTPTTGVYVQVVSTEYHSDDQVAYQAATGWDDVGLWEDPQMLDPANDDFHLQSDSPCIEAGTLIAGLSIDYDGIPLGRGTNPDIGCYETLKGGPRNI